MKFVLIAMTVLFASCMAELAKPDEKVVHPDFVFERAWVVQAELQDLQDDINESVADVVSAVSAVLKTSSATALRRFEDHTDDVNAIFDPAMEDFNSLEESNCRTDAEKIIEAAHEFTGYEAAICAKNYNGAVSREIDVAQKIIYNFDDVYSQVQLIVAKSFIRFNQFLDPEAIEAKINEISSAVIARWNNEKPELAAIRANLAAKINSVYEKELVDCNQDTINFSTSVHLSQFKRMVNTCVALQTPASRSDRIGAPAPLSSDAIYEEFLVLNKQWKIQRGHLL